MRITEGLAAIPPRLLSAEQSAVFATMARSLPRIPLTNAKNGMPQVRAWSVQWPASAAVPVAAR